MRRGQIAPAGAGQQFTPGVFVVQEPLGSQSESGEILSRRLARGRCEDRQPGQDLPPLARPQRSKHLVDGLPTPGGDLLDQFLAEIGNVTWTLRRLSGAARPRG